MRAEKLNGGDEVVPHQDTKEEEQREAAGIKEPYGGAWKDSQRHRYSTLNGKLVTVGIISLLTIFPACTNIYVTFVPNHCSP